MTELAEAREALVYWEGRAVRLPRHAFRRRREARDMAARCRRQVAEAERARYGRGIVGAIAMLVAERRVPVVLQSRSRRLARQAAIGVKLVVASVVALVMLAGVATIELAVALF